MPSRQARLASAEAERNPSGPLSQSQARKLLEDVLQAAIRQKADEIIIDRLSGRPQVRLRVAGCYQELTGIGDGDSFRRLVATARSWAGLDMLPAPAAIERGSFLRLYRKPHLRNAQWRREDNECSFSFYEHSRKNRAVRFDLESYRAPGGEALKISLRPEIPMESTRFDLGFAAAAEEKYIRAARSCSGIVLLTGPCNAGKSTATYHLLSLLRDEGRRIVTVEWPAEWTLEGVTQHDLGDGPDSYEKVGPCLRQAVQGRPDVLLLQNIDWVNDEDAKAAVDFAASGGLLVTAVHSQGCVWGLGNLMWRHFIGQKKDVANLLRVVVSPRRLFMVCMHCAEEYRVPARAFRDAGMSDPPQGADGRVATWRGRGCPLCENSGELGSTAVYEVLDLTGEMRRFLENENDWHRGQLDYLERQAWQHGMRSQRELALERVLAGDISLRQALLNTRKPQWLVEAQAARSRRAQGDK
jgi:type II secretory ATPase GspE/PulE/Tfp pilus assembly ATPase PilB-like protein